MDVGGAVSVTELLAAAITYLERGWSVLPVTPRGKVPLTRHGLKDASTDFEQIQAWWRRWPQANIGVATGPPSGLLVVDLDGREGLGSWARLEARYGVVVTLEAITGGGGVHLVYGYPEDVDLGNSAGRLGQGIDTRGRGGYVLVAPSVHPSGRRYAWSGRGETPVAPAPLWLVDLLQPPPRLVPAIRREWHPGDEQRQLARFNGLLDVMARARPRQRNNQLYWCACRLRELLAEGAPPAWIELLVDAGVATGLGEAEVRRTITSGLGDSTR
jgi:hypothetical protein